MKIEHNGRDLEDGEGSCECRKVYVREWVLVGLDGERLYLGSRPIFYSWEDLSIDAYYFERQRGYQNETVNPYTESTFDLRIVLLGYGTS